MARLQQQGHEVQYQGLAGVVAGKGPRHFRRARWVASIIPGGGKLDHDPAIRLAGWWPKNDTGGGKQIAFRTPLGKSNRQVTVVCRLSFRGAERAAHAMTKPSNAGAEYRVQ